LPLENGFLFYPKYRCSLAIQARLPLFCPRLSLNRLSESIVDVALKDMYVPIAGDLYARWPKSFEMIFTSTPRA
jgi:hypothetical protein